MPLPLVPIPDDAFDTTVPPPQYSSDFASIVGNSVSDTDGFEETFAVAAGHLTDAPNFLTGLDSITTGLAGAGDPAVIPFEQEFSDSLTGTIQQGQGDFDAFGVHLLGNNPPAPGTPPSGGAGSTGGTGGGTGGGAPVPCQFTLAFVRRGAADDVVSQSFTFTNPLKRVLTINQTTLTQDSFVFRYTTNCGTTLQPGATCNFLVEIGSGANGTYSGTLTIDTDDPAGPYAVCLSAQIALPGPGGGPVGA
jgi:hypothetical protein